MSNSEEPEILTLRPRPSTTITLEMPTESYETLARVAENRDISPDPPLKFYIGQGLRHDAARLFSERVMRTTAQVLARHIASEEERAEILREIQQQSAR